MKMFRALSLGLVAVVVLVGLGGVMSASADWRVPGETAAKRKCTLTKIDVRRVGVFPGRYGADYRVQGRVFIRDAGQLDGCKLKVCEAEELGRGNWVPAHCTISIVARGHHRYRSGAPYVDCSNYSGTGWFRSYARFTDSGVSALGDETRLCKRGKPVH
jgi:hypothetical protein